MEGGSAQECLSSLQALSEYHRFLPAEVADRYAEEGEQLSQRFLELLASSSTNAPPSTGELMFGFRCLRSFEELKYPMTVQIRVSIVLSLWRLLVAHVNASDNGTLLYSYTIRTKLVEYLRLYLKHTAEEHLVPIWQAKSPEADVEQQVSLLKELDIRIPIRLLIEEMRVSPRVDCAVGNSRRRNLVFHLVHLCASMQRFLDVSAGAWLTVDLGSKLDGRYCYTMLYAKLLVLTTPLNYIPKAIADGQLWKWWSTMSEGLVPKFDLMWFALLSKYAELHWSNSVSEALASCGGAGREVECHNEVLSQLPWLLNKITRTLSVPFASPAANAVEGNKSQQPPDLDRYPLPEEIDAVVMGNQTTWKDVAKFLVYMLESKPPKEASSSTGWGILKLLQRRIRPFLTPSHAHGEWLWHCVTLLHWLVLSYFKRISRERLLPCKAPTANRLTKEADEAFVALMLPIARDILTSRGPYELATSLENLARLSQISAMHTSSQATLELLSGPVDPFRVDVASIMLRATDVLNDPAQSDRHVALLHLCSSVMPALLLRSPGALGELLPVTLYGIDPTDTPKTLVSMNLIISFFSKIPCLDANDWPGAGGKDAALVERAQWRWPVPAGCDLCSSEDGGASILTTMLPVFAVDFVERVCDYVTRIPKPAKGHAAQQGTGHLESASMGLMHGAVCLVASQCDKDTYKQIVEVISRFVSTTLLPDQVKPTGLLISAIVRGWPEISIELLVPMFLKKLLPRRTSTSTTTALHLTGASESEVRWFLSALCATVRHGGATLLAYRADLEAAMHAALLDEREAVTKLGIKLLRRILYSITGIYINNDSRLCSSKDFDALLAARLSSSAPSNVLAPLRWSGPTPPWWALGSPPSVRWHIPSEQEVDWARALVFGVLGQVSKLFFAVPLPEMPPEVPAGGLPNGSNWLDGLASNLPQKKKASHAAILAVRLSGTVLRGTCELWPDERSNEELKERKLPINLAIAGDTGRILFDCLSDILLAALKALAAQEALGSAPSQGSVRLEPIEVPRVMQKVIKCVGELLGGLRETHPCGMRLFPALRQVDLHSTSLKLQSTALDGLHPRSKWRDLPRVWWVERIADLMEQQLHERCGGHRYSGRRRAILEVLCRQIFQSGFAGVRARALENVSLGTRFHVGSRFPLLQQLILPALAEETQAALRCGSLVGDAADREHQRLNDALSGLAASLGGSIQGLVVHVWRRSVDDAAQIGLALCEAIYAAMKAKDPTAASSDGGYPTTTTSEGTSDQRCEVKPQTAAKLISATKHWLDCREAVCWGATRSNDKAKQLGMEDDDFEVTNVPATSSRSGSPSQGKGMGALEVVDKLLTLCERSDCHWRAQVMATTASLALLNSLSPLARAAVSNTSQASFLDAARTVWRRWGRWIVRCCEPKAQPSLHSLAAHSLLLLLKRPAPLDEESLRSLGLCEPSFMEKLLAVLPQLHHNELMTTAEQGRQDFEPTKDSVNLLTNTGMFRLWPRVWVRKSSRAFSLRNALFWQSYLAFLAKNVKTDVLSEMLRKGAEHLSSQPRAEAEYHAAFTELLAGSLRALRKADTASSDLRRQAWIQLTPLLLVELQQSSQERLEDWCDALRFIVAGCQRPLLKGWIPGSSPSSTQRDESGHLIPLFNFVMGGEGDLPSMDTLTCRLPPVRYDEGTNGQAASFSREGSSFDAFKRLRLLMALLVEPAATLCIEADASFCGQIAEVLKPGLGHPYKQLREEVARALYLTLRAAGSQVPENSSLGSVAAQLEIWLGSEAERLLPALRSDNAAHLKEGEEDVRPRHVIESSGLCYTLLHSALARMTSALLRNASPRSLEFLLAASAHGDFELRTLAAHALSLCCIAHPIPPNAAGARAWTALPMANALIAALQREGSNQLALTDKETEKAFSLALRPVVVANFFILHRGGAEAEGLVHRLRLSAEKALGHSKPEVRGAARSAVAAFLALDEEASLLKKVAEFKALAGPPQKAAAGTSEAMFAGVAGLSCALLAAADCGVPSWSGKAIQAVSIYGRPGAAEAIQREIQGSIQAFLKLQQSSQRSWHECKEKLTPAQLELLNDSKGKLSYFS